MSLTPPRERKPLRRPSPAKALELSRHWVRAQEEERRRISRELHDGTGQALMVLRLYLGMLGSTCPDTESQLKVHEALGLLDRTVEDLRRIIGRLSPRTLEELGLLAAIRKEVRQVSRNTGMKASLCLPKSLPGVDRDTELALYRGVQEALHNVAKHSKTDSFAVRLEEGAGKLTLVVEDVGIGFARTRSTHAFGLRGMRERIAALGGTLRIRSGHGRGTRIRMTVPIAPAEISRPFPALERPPAVGAAETPAAYHVH